MARWSQTIQHLYPTLLPEDMLEHSCSITSPKNTFASRKNSKNFWNHFFIFKNHRKISTNSLLATASLLNGKFYLFTSPINLVSTRTAVLLSERYLKWKHHRFNEDAKRETFLSEPVLIKAGPLIIFCK